MAFAFVPRWSALKQLGETRVMKFTILAPLLGPLIFLDQKWNLLHHYIVGTPADVNTPESLLRLYRYYVALMILGFAQALFVVFCPAIVKSYSIVSEYIRFEVELNNIDRYLSVVRRTLWKYKNQYKSSSMVRKLMRSALFPTGLGASFRRLVQQHGWNWPHTPQGHSTLRDKDGNFRIIDIAEVFNSDDPQNEVVMQSIHSIQGNMMRDYLAFDYQLFDISNPLIRILIGVLYIIGFLLLTVLSLQTFYKLFMSSLILQTLGWN